MIQALFDLGRRANLRREDGAVGWMVLGIVIGIGLVIFAIIKFLIPGD